MSSVLFSDPRKLKTVELPSFKGSQVIMYDQLLCHDLTEIGSMDLSTSEQGVESVFRSIKDWNFIDEKGVKTSISKENILKLPSDDLFTLAGIMSGKSVEEIKKEGLDISQDELKKK